MRRSKLALIGITSVLLLMAAGCVRPTTLGPDYGLAYRAARDNQILNPQARFNREPMAELDGQANVFVVERYRKRFKAPEEFAPSISIPSLVTSGVQTE